MTVMDPTMRFKGSNIEETKALYMMVHNKNVDEQRRYSGYVFEKFTDKVVCVSPQATIEINDLPQDGMENKQTRTLEYCEDGTVVRLYNYNNEWYTATNRCINAKESFWANMTSFHDLFFEVFNKLDLVNLDINFTYVFILLHKDNRIVVRHNTNTLVYLGKMFNSLDKDTNNQIHIENLFVGNPLIKLPESIEYTPGITLDELFTPLKRGLIIKSNDTTDVYRIDFDKYKEAKQVRGNTPNIKLRIIELAKESSYMLEVFRNTFSEHVCEVDEVMSKLDNLVNSVYKLYVDSHIKHKVHVGESNLYYRTLKQLHAQYKTTGVPISVDAVKAKIFSLDKFVIYNLCEL